MFIETTRINCHALREDRHVSSISRWNWREEYGAPTERRNFILLRFYKDFIRTG